MKSSLIQWHLSRDNQIKLARFCSKHKVSQSTSDIYYIDGIGYFKIKYNFSNNGFIVAELMAGDTRSYSVADHFQVVDYQLGDN